MPLPKRHKTIVRTDFDIDPNEGELAFASSNDKGMPGALNSLVLGAYGSSSNKVMPDEKELQAGYSSMTTRNGKNIIFVVTVKNTGSTAQHLSTNLFNALLNLRGLLGNRKVWMPLMGTGAGGLTLRESYEITVATINKFQAQAPTNTEILLSIPETPQGYALQDLIFHDEETQASGSEADFHNEVATRSFYLVDSIWRDTDQTKRFIVEGNWETRPDADHAPTINKVNEDDILILKSLKSVGGESRLVLKALGVVTQNPNDGFSLKVDWRTSGLPKEIPRIGPYRVAIGKLQSSAVYIILKALDKSLLADTFSTSSDTSMPGIAPDSDTGKDELDIGSDVNAFAKVIVARNYPPPLAIALFGKWGSGKSFFMKKLKERIKALTTEGDGAYCEGVVHIHFNAWSYIDTNLWASIVTKIFEDLHNYISQDQIADEEKKEIVNKLTSELSVAKEEKALLESRKKAAEEQIKILTKKKEELKGELDKKIEQVKTKTLFEFIKTADNTFDAKNQIVKAIQENESIQVAKEDLKSIVPEEYWNNPSKGYEVAKSRITFLREFFKKGGRRDNILWIVLIGIAIIVVPVLVQVISIYIKAIDFTFSPAIASMFTLGWVIWQRAEKVYARLQPIVSAFWKVKEAHESVLQAERSKFEQEEKALKFQIDKDKSEVLLMEDQIQKAEAVKTDLEFRINNTFATEALHSFIDKRSKTDEYKKHLGIISTIRKDFEILNSLFNDHNTEARKIENVREFRERFKQPLERIVLYIDDLDRCPEDNVVQVLEAVNLLMAFPLFVVVVGVDSRWIKNALRKKHILQFEGNNISDNEMYDYEILEPSNYLEKIFQIAFHLKEANDDSVKNMIRKLAKPEIVPLRIASAKVIQQPTPGNNQTIEVSITTRQTENGEMVEKETYFPQNNSSAAVRKEQQKAIEFNQYEIMLMEDLWDVIGSNPRAIKRFVNTYRIIKAHEKFEYRSNREDELSGVLFLLALPLGNYGGLLDDLEKFVYDPKNEGKKMSAFFEPGDNHNEKVIELEKLISGKHGMSAMLNLSVSLIKKQNAFIRRFTFRNL